MDTLDTMEFTEKLHCIKCDYTTSHKGSFKKHLLSAKHLMDTSEFTEKLHCIKCDYTTSHKGSFKKHLLSAKHLMDTINSQVTNKFTEEFQCNCGKTYRYSQGLSKHRRVCNTNVNIDVKYNEDIDEKNTIPQENIYNIPDKNDLIMAIIKENQEFKNLLIEQNKQVMELQKENKDIINKMVEITQNQLIATTTINNNNSNNTVNNNQKFNLNVFLNETCKDAMSIQEFIENICINFEDLLTIGSDGFVNGVSDILIKQLRDLEINKRPIHCTDAKRETIYLKEEAAWNKDDKEKTKLKQMIEKIEYKNVVALHNWCNENPDAKVNNTPNNILKDKIFYETLQGDERTREKIIKNVSKEIILDKEPVAVIM